MSVSRYILIILMAAPGWGCNDQTAQGDGGAGGDASSLLPDSAGAGTVVGSGTVVPWGKPPKGPFKFVWSRFNVGGRAYSAMKLTLMSGVKEIQDDAVNRKTVCRELGVFFFYSTAKGDGWLMEMTDNAF